VFQVRQRFFAYYLQAWLFVRQSQTKKKVAIIPKNNVDGHSGWIIKGV
jgi:hypothetical protein